MENDTVIGSTANGDSAMTVVNTAGMEKFGGNSTNAATSNHDTVVR